MQYLKCILLLILLLNSCSSSAKEKDNTLQKYDFKAGEQFELIPKLNEISDVTVSKDGNIFAITDEIGTIYQINPQNGKVLKRFFLGRWTAEADFEGLACSGKKIFAIKIKC